MDTLDLLHIVEPPAVLPGETTATAVEPAQVTVEEKTPADDKFD